MSDKSNQVPGKILWVDLTVPNAAHVRDFYAQVVGWEVKPVEMGGYSDYNMLPPGSEQPAAGICYARGMNSEFPAQWLIYISVPDVNLAVERALSLGGTILVAPRKSGSGGFCVIQDPAGAVAALYTP
jgi:predicted enzyme related to lactoylglutathione lyase